MYWYKYLIAAIILLFPLCCQAQLVMNEIYPAPKDGEYEWLELYNPTSEPLATDQYVIKDATGKPMIINTAIVAPLSFGLATSSALLNNKDETIILAKKTGETIQTVTYTATFDSEKSYAVCPDGSANWIVTTPSRLALNTCPTPTPTFSPTAAPSPSPIPVSAEVNAASPPSGITLSEIYPAPLSGENEWAELYNDNDHAVTLTNWYIDTHQFSITIPAHGFAAIDITTSSFNNAGDTVHLLDSSKTTIDTLRYESTLKGFSIGHESTAATTTCIQETSKGKPNNPCHKAPHASAGTDAAKNSIPTKVPTQKNPGTGATKTTKPRLYEGIINPASTNSSAPPVDEKEYKVAGYKNPAQPLIIFLARYGWYIAITLSLLAIGMILYKMKRYLYEKDALMALALVTAVFINGYHLLSVLPT